MLYHTKCYGKLDLKGDRDYFVRNLFNPICPKCKEEIDSKDTIPCIPFCDAVVTIKLISRNSDDLAKMIVDSISKI